MKYRLHEDLQTCENGNPPAKFILGNNLPQKIKEAKDSLKLLL